jgi:metal-responsive CopG/Arc/MetJ family transcriptional regulator
MKKKRNPGRPPADGVRAMHRPLAIRLPDPMLERIDEIVASRMDEPDRSAVIRELLAEALEAREKRGRR